MLSSVWWPTNVCGTTSFFHPVIFTQPNFQVLQGCCLAAWWCIWWRQNMDKNLSWTKGSAQVSKILNTGRWYYQLLRMFRLGQIWVSLFPVPFRGLWGMSIYVFPYHALIPDLNAPGIQMSLITECMEQSSKWSSRSKVIRVDNMRKTFNMMTLPPPSPKKKMKKWPEELRRYAPTKV